MRPYRWIPHDGNRHAVTVALGPGDHALTLCGLPLDIPAEPPPAWPDDCWPECSTCDEQWRVAEGIPTRHRQT